MTNQIITNEELLFGGYRLSPKVKSFALGGSVDTQDDTALGDTTRSAKAGLHVITASCAGLFDAGSSPDDYDSFIFNKLGIANEPFTFLKGGTEGDAGYFFKSMLTEYVPISGTAGDIHEFSLVAQSTKSNLVRGKLLSKQSARTTDGTSTPIQMGAITSGKKGYAALHIISPNSSADTIAITVESNATGTFSGAQTTRISFATASARSGQLLTVDGPVTDTYWRVKWDIGASQAFSFYVIFGIL